MPTELEWSYLAGIIDGEGCITISIRSNRKVFSVNHRMLVYNTSRLLVDWIQARFGGFLRVHIREGLNHKPDGVHEGYGRKTVYRLDWCSVEDIKHILNGILPYLTIKREVASKLFELLDTPNELEEERLEMFNTIKEVQSNG